MYLRSSEDWMTISTDGLQLIRQIVEMFDVAGITTEIICASVRHPIHVTECALAGADIATVPYKVIEQMTKHPLTDAGIEKFQNVVIVGYNWKPFFFSGDWLRTPLADWSCLFLSICFCKYSFKSLHPL